jgi:hypothetical protein
MDEIVAAIEAALEAKHLSAAAASRAAVGNPALIKNLLNRKPNKRDHPVENLMKLAEVLDLEFYFGPRRPRGVPAIPGMAESPGQTTLGAAEVVPYGYRPIPWHPDLPRRSGVPVAFEAGFLRSLEMPLERLFVVQPETVASGGWLEGGVALVETPATREQCLRPWCFLIDRKAHIGLVQFARQGAMIFRHGVRDEVDLVPPGDQRIIFLGRVVWYGARVTG